MIVVSIFLAEIKKKQKQTIQQEEKKRQTENNILLFVSSIRGTVSPYYICKWIFTMITFLMTCFICLPDNSYIAITSWG
jgi:hypothetical protein